MSRSTDPEIEQGEGSSSFPHLSATLGRAWTLLRRVFIAGLLVAGGVILLEAIHLHSLLAGIHPILAWTVSGLLLMTVAGFLSWAAWRWAKIPRVILPPDLPTDLEEWNQRQLNSYLAFCRRYVARQERNPSLPEEARERLPALLAAIDDATRLKNPVEVVAQTKKAIDEALEPLDRLARNVVWRAATEVAVLTAMTPSALFDVLITLLRNIELMVRIATLYYSRPGLLGTTRIVRDVMAVAAAAGVIERVTDSASEMAADVMGNWTSKLAGPVGQGVANGLITVRLGDAAVHRCRALRTRRVGIKPWDAATWREASRRLARMVSKKVAPDIARRFGAIVEATGGDAVRSSARFLKRLFGVSESR